VKQSLVKVWAFDAAGIPTQSGTGFVVASDRDGSWVLTAQHVVDGADSVRVDLNRDVHDLRAVVADRTPAHQDLALLRLTHGGLPVARMSSAEVTEGKPVAAAGYFQDDEQIGTSGQEPQLVGPATISSLREDGDFIGVNLDLEPGLSGAPIFDPQNGEVEAVADVKNAVGVGGYAVSAPRVAAGLLAHNHLDVHEEDRALAVSATTAPLPSPAAGPQEVAVSSGAAATDDGAQSNVTSSAVTPTIVTPTTVSSAPDTATAVASAVDLCFGRTAATADEAGAACSGLAEHDPSNPMLHERLCAIHDAQGHVDAAIDSCTAALRVHPDDELALARRARLYAAQRRWALALADAQRAIALNPNLARAYVARGMAYEGTSARERAADDYAHAIRLDARQRALVERSSKLPLPSAEPAATSGSGLSEEERARLRAEGHAVPAALPAAVTVPHAPAEHPTSASGGTWSATQAEEAARIHAEEQARTAARASARVVHPLTAPPATRSSWPANATNPARTNRYAPRPTTPAYGLGRSVAPARSAVALPHPNATTPRTTTTHTKPPA
jgi:hypothetical protein